MVLLYVAIAIDSRQDLFVNHQDFWTRCLVLWFCFKWECFMSWEFRYHWIAFSLLTHKFRTDVLAAFGLAGVCGCGLKGENILEGW